MNSVLSYALTNSLSLFYSLTVWWAVVEFVPIVTMVPRFTISLRQLYARDVQQGRESTLDTAFGFGYDEVIASMIMFADAQPGQHVEPQWDEEVALQARNIGTANDAA